jgi:predicted DNA-binding protein
MQDDQVTLRVPGELSSRLREQARARGVPASQIVREALQAYLSGAEPEDAAATWRRVAPLVGSIALDPADLERDALAGQLRAHNWRE